MPSKRSQIQYMVTIYITAHGRAETETDTVVNLSERDVYIGQETGNCSVQSKQHDEQLLETVTNWDNAAKWLSSGAHVSAVEHEDYKIGAYMFEDQASVVYSVTTAIVGPTQKKNKIMDMEGRSGEISRPGIVIIIQERETKNPKLGKSVIRSILNKIYTRSDGGLDQDPTGADHRFSAIYLNNQFIEPNDRTRDNILSKEFNDYVTENNELSLSDIIDTAKAYASQVIDVKPNSKNILYTIADTTCNVYATEDIERAPSVDQDDLAVEKSVRKAKTLATLFDKGQPASSANVDPEIVAVTPGHESGFWFTMKPESRRLRMRPSDKPGKTADLLEDVVDEIEESEDQDDFVNPDLYVHPSDPASSEFPSLFKSTRKKAPKKKHQTRKGVRHNFKPNKTTTRRTLQETIRDYDTQKARGHKKSDKSKKSRKLKKSRKTKRHRKNK